MGGGGGNRKFSSNSESSGRFHTDWLNMMYPRLKLARNLLREDGVIFISIDDNEVHHIREMLDDIFGNENFAGIFIWKKKTNGNNMGLVPPVHDYLVGYGKSIESISDFGFPLTQEYIDRNYANPDNHPKGLWTTQDLSANHKGPYFPITNKKTGDVYYPSEGRYWVFNEAEVLKRIDDGRIIFGKSGNSSPVQRVFLIDKGGKRIKAESWWDKHGMNEDATAQLKTLFTVPKVFDHTKPVQTIQHLINISTNPKENDLILDFFAGSGTTGNAVMVQNAADSGNRRFILVQLPEPLDALNKDQKTAADFCDALGKPRNIAELTKERLRRAAEQVKAGKPDFDADYGFRVYKLDSTNIQPWDPDPQDVTGSLFAAQEHLKSGRTEHDILTELLLKLGLPLTVPIEERTIDGHDLYAVGAGTLLACLAPRIEGEAVESVAQALVAWRRELAPVGESQVVLRDSAFRSDVTKANFTAILEQAGFNHRHIRSL